jgi:shikimate dehydrogenase
MRQFGLIGRPLSHSFSQSFFTEKFEKEGLADCRYQNYELHTIGEVSGLLDSVPGLLGLNVTIPFKEQILPFLAATDPVVKAIGACNCIKIEGKQMLGFNTDATGFTRALQPFLKSFHTQALVLGNGGASKAVQFALAALNIPCTVVVRAPSEGLLTYKDVNEDLVTDHLVVINTTPLGTFPNTDAVVDIPFSAVGKSHLLFDLVYNPAVTTFLRRGAERGAQISNGYQMLVEQAEESWIIWNRS